MNRRTFLSATAGATLAGKRASANERVELAVIGVRGQGRSLSRRFAAFADPAVRERIPDPNALTTFQASTLNWAERGATSHRERLALVRELLAIRAQHIVPRLAGARSGGQFDIVNGALCVAWPLAQSATLRLALNFADAEATLPQAPQGELLYALGAHVQGGALRMAASSAYVALEADGG